MDLTEEYVKRVLQALIYIENHIDEELSLEKLAKVACYSPFHFHRIFQAITGETVHQYVKRLRLQKAAGKLRYTEQSVTEIALDTNYDTPSAFTKAFKQFMSASPTRYRTLNAFVHTVSEKIKELPMIQPNTIEKKLPNLPLLFIRRYGSYTKSPGEAWQAMRDFIKREQLPSDKVRYFGISHDDPEVTSEDKLRFDAAITTNQEIREKGEVGRQTLKGGKYAVFIHLGPYQTLEQTFAQIFLKWLPNTQEQMDESRVIFCEYFHMERLTTAPEQLETKIYIPLQ